MAKKVKKKLKGLKVVNKRDIYSDPIYNVIIRLAEYGKTDKQIASIIGVSLQTIKDWKNNKEGLLSSIKDAKVIADLAIEATLLEKALGYTALDTKIFFDAKTGKTVEHTYEKVYAPCPTSIIFWLKNRQPNKWRDRKEIDANINVNNITDWLHSSDEDDDNTVDITPEAKQIEEPKEDT